MVTRYGMSDKLGEVVLDSDRGEVFLGRSMARTKPYSEEVAGQVDREVRALLDSGGESYEERRVQAKALLNEAGYDSGASLGEMTISMRTRAATAFWPS